MLRAKHMSGPNSQKTSRSPAYYVGLLRAAHSAAGQQDAQAPPSQELTVPRTSICDFKKMFSEHGFWTWSWTYMIAYHLQCILIPTLQVRCP